MAHLGAEEGRVLAVPRECFLDAALFEAQILVHYLHHFLRQLPDFFPVLLHGLLEVRRVGRPFVVVSKNEHVLPVHVVQALTIAFFHQCVQQLNGFGSLEALLPQLIALGADLLHAFQQLDRNPMVHQLKESPFLASIGNPGHGFGPFLAIQLGEIDDRNRHVN